MKLKVLVHLKTSNGTLTQGKILDDAREAFCPSIMAEVKVLKQAGSSKNIEILPDSFQTPADVVEASKKLKTADDEKAADVVEAQRLEDEENARLAQKKKDDQVKKDEEARLEQVKKDEEARLEQVKKDEEAEEAQKKADEEKAEAEEAQKKADEEKAEAEEAQKEADEKKAAADDGKTEKTEKTVKTSRRKVRKK